MNASRRPSSRVLMFCALVGISQLLPICTPGGSAMAQDCNNPGTQIQLFSQADVNDFQTNYGPCVRIGGSLEINSFGMDPITDLSPLTDLVEVAENLWVEGDMVNLNGLHNLVSIGEGFTIGGNQLTNLSGLSGLQSVRVLELIGLPSLQNLSGLSNLATVEILRLESLPSLTSIGGLPAAVDVDTLLISSMAQLTSLDGAPTMSSLRILALDSNQMLTDLSGLAASTIAADPPDESAIGISNNWVLPNLVGLPVGDKVGSLGISGNSALASLAGLENLVEVWSLLNISENPFLGDCSILATVLDAIDDGDAGPGDGSNPDDPPDTVGLESIQISNNGEALGPDAQCNSIEEIVASASGKPIHADGFEGETL